MTTSISYTFGSVAAARRFFSTATVSVASPGTRVSEPRPVDSRDPSGRAYVTVTDWHRTRSCGAVLDVLAFRLQNS